MTLIAEYTLGSKILNRKYVGDNICILLLYLYAKSVTSDILSFYTRLIIALFFFFRKELASIVVLISIIYSYFINVNLNHHILIIQMRQV